MRAFPLSSARYLCSCWQKRYGIPLLDNPRYFIPLALESRGHIPCLKFILNYFMMGINIIDANICHNFLHLFKIQIRTVSQETLHHFLAWKSTSYFRVEMSKELMTVFLNQTHLVEKHTRHIFSGVSLTISFDIFKSPRAPLWHRV